MLDTEVNEQLALLEGSNENGLVIENPISNHSFIPGSVHFNLSCLV